MSFGLYNNVIYYRLKSKKIIWGQGKSECSIPVHPQLKKNQIKTKGDQARGQSYKSTALEMCLKGNLQDFLSGSAFEDHDLIGNGNNARYYIVYSL